MIKEQEKQKKKKNYDTIIIELIKKADERQKQCIYQFAKAIIGEG